MCWQKPGDMVQSAAMQHGILSEFYLFFWRYSIYFSSTKRKINKNTAKYSKSNGDYSDITVCQCCKICVGKVPHTPTGFSSPSSGDYVHFDQKHKTLPIHNLCLVACLAAVHTPVFIESWHADSLRSGPILSYAGMRRSLPGRAGLSGWAWHTRVFRGSADVSPPFSELGGDCRRDQMIMEDLAGVDSRQPTLLIPPSHVLFGSIKLIKGGIGQLIAHFYPG